VARSAPSSEANRTGGIWARRIAGQERVVADPEAEIRRTEERIAVGLEQQRPRQGTESDPARARFVNTPPGVAPDYFQGRQAEFRVLGEFLSADDEQVMTVVGPSGVGKTALVCRLLKALEDGQLPDGLGPLEIDGIVYLGQAGAHHVNFPNLFAGLCQVLPPEAARYLLQQYRDPRQTLKTLMYALLHASTGRVIVLLDQVEDIIDTSTGDFAITDRSLDEALRALLTMPARGVKVILTTRVAPRALLLVHPARQRVLDLDEGLGSPYAEEMLRARDPDGRLGLQTASDELLGQARRRARGYPRALEAVTAILATDQGTTLPELLDQTARLPDNTVEALIAEAFSRLDPLAQQVIQALAIFPVPVPPVAVDYLLQPYQPAIDAAPVLERLVTMRFVHRDAGRYYLHQADRDYAIGRIPAGQPAVQDADPAPFTQRALRQRGADYFAQIRMPEAAWQTLEDLVPQLNEFELRCQGGDYDTAARVLLAIDLDYLNRWGHYRLTIQMHEQLQGHLKVPLIDAVSKFVLGSCYRSLGELPAAIRLYEYALAVSREIGDRDLEGFLLDNLASTNTERREYGRAVELYQQALAIAREIGDLRREGVALSNLASAYVELGQTDQAAELYWRALDIARETGDRDGEGTVAGNLASTYAELGDHRRAAELYQHALGVARETGDRSREGVVLNNLASAYVELGQTDQAAELYQDALGIARETGNRYREGTVAGNLASTYAELGDHQRAVELYQRALDIARQGGDLRWEGLLLRNLASAHAGQGDTQRAAEAYQASRVIAGQTGDQPLSLRMLPTDTAPRCPEGGAVDATRPGDRVECSVFAPMAVPPGWVCLIQVFAHMPDQASEAMSRAREFDADSARRAIKTLESSVPRGTKLAFCLTMPGLQVDDPVQSMVWWGTTESVQFGVSVPEQCPPGGVVGTITISQDWVPIGHIKFSLTVAAGPSAGQPYPAPATSAVGESAKRYETAFISYASADRTKVLERVQILPMFGVRTFQDVLDLGPGERWEKSLYRHIDECDIVLLFWSNAAKRSKWVRKEVQYALDRKCGDESAPPEIGPVIIEGPPVPRPWKELSYLHFNDRMIYFMNR
jgi:tetratricopeptide (TPR) repeat protein